jgi:hypothetical protein
MILVRSDTQSTYPTVEGNFTPRNAIARFIVWPLAKPVLRNSARAAGIDELRASRISDYDFRHSRLTFLGTKTDNLSGVMYLAGHKQPATTARYLRPQRSAAEEVLASAHARGRSRAAARRAGRRSSARGVLAARTKKPAKFSARWIRNSLVISPLCEEGDSNPHGC